MSDKLDETYTVYSVFPTLIKHSFYAFSMQLGAFYSQPTHF